MKLPSRWIPQVSINTWIRIAAGLAVVLAFLVNEAEWYQYRFVQQLELWAYDTRLRLFMPNTLDPRVVILDIDEKSLGEIGRWPWSRNLMAELLDKLFERMRSEVFPCGHDGAERVCAAYELDAKSHVLAAFCTGRPAGVPSGFVGQKD